METLQKSYYAIIPANVRYDTELPANAKLLYGEITALCNEKGYCWAGNEYFASLYKVSKTSISKWISKLIEQGYITSEIIYREGSKEILHRYLRIVNNPIEEKLKRSTTKVKEPIEDKLKDNNTVNNTSNNTNNNDKEVLPETKNLINLGFISEEESIKYNDLITTALMTYRVDQVKRVINYILINSSEEITDKYAYFETSLFNNLKKIDNQEKGYKTVEVPFWNWLEDK
jgi:DNA-binding transcriptional ArsR family regulator